MDLDKKQGEGKETNGYYIVSSEGLKRYYYLLKKAMNSSLFLYDIPSIFWKRSKQVKNKW